MSKRKKSSVASPPHEVEDKDSVTTVAVVPPEVMKRAMGGEGEGDGDGDGEAASTEHAAREPEHEPAHETDHEPMPESAGVPVEHEDPETFDAEMTVNLVGDLPLPGRDDLDEPTVTTAGEALADVDGVLLQRKHLRGLLEALVFASDAPITPKELAKLASAPQKQVKELLAELKTDYATRGMHLDEVAGGWVFRTSPQYAPFVRDLTKQKPVRLTRAQVETLAIIAYRQPITRPEIDDVRGVDSGPVLKLLLERDLVRILGKRDEPGRPLIYGTTSHFLEFFGLKSLKDLPTLREFTELSDESRADFEDELGESPEDAAARAVAAEAARERGEGGEGESESESESHSESDDESDENGRAVPESMSVRVGEQPIDELGEDDLEPIEGSDDPEDADEAPPQPEKHASDDDGPTLTSEAPVSDED
ncbi:MAG: Segregation and condensation protein [Labilithrix sp.]|nr:Segregation and condensation protein [Labilithrix sp.]